ncbi:MAG TPA: ABC transporter permease [Solirubrobacteraceae bacterium]|nr:ABC transporter permease [Solirubrobacteraceae bacterium]
MSTYIARRVLRAIVLIVLIIVLGFLLFTVLAGAGGSFPSYLKSIFLHFNFGYSARDHQSVVSLVVSRLPATLSLLVGAGLLAVALGVPIGILAALRRSTRFDRVAMGTALALVSMPVFWLGLILLYLFASDVGKIPIFPGGNSYVGLTANPGKWFTSLILPWLVLGAVEAAIYSRLLRGRMTAAMKEDYVLGARARGLSEERVIWGHGAVAAVAGMVAVVGLDIGGLLGGAVLTETAFRIHGIGFLSYDALAHSDLPVVQGTVLLAAMMIVVVSLIVDIGFAWLDPRVTVA